MTDPGVSVEQIANDFGVHPMTLFKWLRQADIDNVLDRRTWTTRQQLRTAIVTGSSRPTTAADANDPCLG